MTTSPAVPEIVSVVKNDADNDFVVTVQGRDNELTLNQSSLETDARGWVPGVFTTIARTTAQASDGAASLQLTKDVAVGVGYAQTPGGIEGVPVVVGRTYTMLASYRAAATARTCQTSITWADATGAVISTVTSVGVTHGTGGWTQDSVTATAPANTVFALLTAQVNDMAVGEVSYVDKVSLAPGTSTTWTQGGFVYGDNLLTANQASIETDTTGWAAGTNATIARTTAQALVGAASLQITHTAGISLARTPTGVSGIPIVATNNVFPHTAIASFRSSAVPRPCRMSIVWLDSAGVIIREDLSEFVTSSTTGWVTTSVTASPPTEVFYAYINVWSNSAVGESTYVDRIWFGRGSRIDWGGLSYVANTRRLQLQRSQDGGSIWSNVFGSNTVVPIGQQLAVVDQEAGAYASTVYRVRSVIPTFSFGAVSDASAWSASSSAQTLSSPTSWFLKALYEPDLSISVCPDNVRMQLARPLGVAYPLLGDAAVVTHNGTKGRRISATVRTLSQAEYRALLAVIEDGRTLLLQAIHGEQWYVQVGDGITFNMLRARPAGGEVWPVRHAHEVDIDFIEVGQPEESRLPYGY